MPLSRTCRILFPALLLVAVADSARAQPDAKPSQSDMKKRFAAMASAPTDQHKLLAAFVGDFDQVSEVFVGPGEPLKANSASKGEWVMGGRFVKVTSAATKDEELKGDRLTVYGYDPDAKKFTMWNIDSMGPTSVSAKGDYDPESKTFTFEGERQQPRAGMVPFRWVLKLEEKGSLAHEIQMKLPGAKEYTTFVKVKYSKTK